MNNLYKFVATAAVAGPILLGGCSTNAGTIKRKRHVIVTKPVPATPIQKKRRELGGPTWKRGWTNLVERSVPRAMLSRRVPRDVRRFCPRFYRMDATGKRQFWAYFFQALAGAESGLNKVANVHHLQPSVNVRDDVTGRMSRQEGLLQLSYMDSDRYDCNFNWDSDKHLPLHDPEKTILRPANNLRCGMKILYNQIITFQRPILYQDSYWATLRPGTAGNANFMRQMTNPPAACTEPPGENLAARQDARKSSRRATQGASYLAEADPITRHD